MIKAPISLRDLRRRIYRKAKAEPAWRFWGLYVHVCKLETLREAYRLAKQNDGAPGVDGVTFEIIEAGGLEAWLQLLRAELLGQSYRPTRLRRVEIPKRGSKGVRVLSIPTIRDRVVQGALKLILEPMCSEASNRSSRWKSCRWRYPDATVVISDGEEGDRLDRKLGSKSLWRPMATSVRSAREASNSAGCTK